MPIRAYLKNLAKSTAHSQSKLIQLLLVIIWILSKPTQKIISLIRKVSVRLEKILIKIDESLKKNRQNFNWLLGSTISNNLDLKKTHLRAYGKYLDHLKYITSEMAIQPKISIIMPVYKVDTRYLIEAIESVLAQTYENWELCIVDDHSNSSSIERLLVNYQERFPKKIKLRLEKINRHISETSNIALDLSSGEYIAFLDHDDRLYPNALGEVVRHINLHQEPDILYSDERNTNSFGDPCHLPFFKPDFSPYLHLSVNYTTHFSVYSRSVYEKIGGLRKGYEGSQDHDFMLRACEQTEKPVVHIPYVLYQWRIHPLSSAAGIENKSYAIEAGIKAVSDALIRRDIKGHVGWDSYTQRYRLNLSIVGNPKVSIIIPNKNNPDVLSRCVNSIFKKTTYKNFEVIVIDNGSEDPRVFEFLNKTKKEKSNFSHLSEKSPFNFGKLNNIAADHAKGDYLLFLNNDTEVITPEWIEEMLMFAQQAKVAAVGPKLLFEDGTIQHAGIRTFGRMIAGNAGVGEPELSNSYCHFYNTVREVAAVTAACLLIKREIFYSAGKFDTIWCPNGWGDVEFCLRLLKLGFYNLFTPYAKLYHCESKTRGITVELFERDYLLKKYSEVILNDPFSNINLNPIDNYSLDPMRDFDLSNAEMLYFMEKN